MTSSSFKNPTEIMQNNSEGILNAIFKKTAQLNQLNEIWLQKMESPLTLHSRVANYRDHCLVIEVESSVWATQLRFSIPEIIEKLRMCKEFAGLQKVEWYVRRTSP